MASSSKKAVYSAIFANTVVAILKFVGFVLTGSAALLSEGIHSVADVSNQILLAIGIARSEKAADVHHPYGYGRDKFIFAMISAVGIFWFGCGVTVYHGIHAIQEQHLDTTVLPVAIGILVVSGIIEMGTLWVAWTAVRDGARSAGMTMREFVVRGSDPMGVAVLLEDGAAVLGVGIALVGVGLSLWTHDPIYDGISTLLIGALLGCVAIFLVVKNRLVLLGQSMSDQQTERVLDVLTSDPVVGEVLDIKTTVMGSETARFKAEIQFDGEMVTKRFLERQDMAAIRSRLNDPDQLQSFLIGFGDDIVEALGDEIDRIESKIQKENPKVKHVDIETN